MSALMDALLAIQKDPPKLFKDAKNSHYKNTYITLGKVLDALLPRFHEAGILLLQPVVTVLGQPALRTTLRHMESKEEYTVEMLLVLDREAPQAQGSAITYARRYSLLSLLGLDPDEDDDAEAAEAPIRKKAKAVVRPKRNGKPAPIEEEGEPDPW